jgi:hypothetical protein
MTASAASTKTDPAFQVNNECRPEPPFPACIRCMAGLTNRRLFFEARSIIFCS